MNNLFVSVRTLAARQPDLSKQRILRQDQSIEDKQRQSSLRLRSTFIARSVIFLRNVFRLIPSK